MRYNPPMRAMLRVLVLMGMILTGLSAVLILARRTPAEPPYIVFRAATGRIYTLYRMRPDGSAITPLTTLPVSQQSAGDYEPAWSPDGRWIVFSSTRQTDMNTPDLYIVRSDGREMHRLLATIDLETSPVWSPDGQWIVFQQRAFGGNRRLYRISVNGGEPILMSPPASQDGSAAFSPDGQQIIFVSVRNGLTRSQLFLMSADDPLHALPISSGGNFHEQPTWSPDGRWIAFAAGGQTGIWEIYKMRPDGTGLQQLTHPDGYDTGPTWSPDGQWIAFSSNRHADGATHITNDVFRVRPDGSDIQRLTHGMEALDPAYAPIIDQSWAGVGWLIMGLLISLAGVFSLRPHSSH